MTGNYEGADLCVDPKNEQYYGVAKEVTATPQLLLRVNRPNGLAGMNALASVHVYEADVTLVTQVAGVDPANQNSRLVLEVSWESGIAGGGIGQTTRIGPQRVFVDATRGSFFTVAGSNSLTILAYLQSSVAAEALSIYATKRVEASVHWGTSINPVKARWSPPAVVVTPAAPAFVHIPRQAESMIVQTDNPAALATLTARFVTDQNVATRAIYNVLNPNSNGCLITGGVEWVRFVSTAGDHLLTPVFDLWI